MNILKDHLQRDCQMQGHQETLNKCSSVNKKHPVE